MNKSRRSAIGSIAVALQILVGSCLIFFCIELIAMIVATMFALMASIIASPFGNVNLMNSGPRQYIFGVALVLGAIVWVRILLSD